MRLAFAGAKNASFTKSSPSMGPLVSQFTVMAIRLRPSFMVQGFVCAVFTATQVGRVIELHAYGGSGFKIVLSFLKFLFPKQVT